MTVTPEFATLDAAQKFVASDELRSAMADAGVAGEPTIWFRKQSLISPSRVLTTAPDFALLDNNTLRSVIC